jgi:hypothetical protein
MKSLASITNPFRSAIVSDPWHWDVVDVPEIHKEAFDLCRSSLDYVRTEHQSTSVLIYGEAGSGKTHLLARLQAYLAGHLTIYGQAPAAVFVSVRLQTSPQMIWRHLRNKLGEDLLRPTADGRSQLERILLPRIAAVCADIGEPGSWLERVQREARNSSSASAASAASAAIDEMEDVLDRLDQQTRLDDRDLMVVIGHLLLGRFRRDARAWLRGDSLPENSLRQLGLNADQDYEAEERARRMVLSLTRLTGPDIPLVICFDQVEALQSHQNDLAGLYKYGQMIGFLRDETSNTLLISCILSTFLSTLKQAIISSDLDRLALAGERNLASLTPGEAKRLVEARLNSSAEMREVRPAGLDRFWPLKETDIDEALRLRKNTPRLLLSYCAEKFDLVWRPDLLNERLPVEDFLNQNIEERLEQSAATASAEQADQILTHGLPMLLRLSKPAWESRVIERFRDADMVFESPRGRITIILCNHRNMTSLAGRLRRLRDQIGEEVLEDSTREKFILLRDARLPIGTHARKTREHREQLLAHGFQWVNASSEMIAALDALRGLISDTKAGDLSCNGESISISSVQEWLMANLDRKLPPLRELLDEVLPENNGFNDEDFEICDDLNELLNNHHLVSVTDAAFRLGCDEARIESLARLHPERFGLLNGPPAVLFQLTLQAPDSADKPGMAIQEVR